MNTKIHGLMLKTVCAFVLISFQYAHAATPVVTVNCSGASHLTDFQNCINTVVSHIGPGTYVTFGPSKFTIAHVAAHSVLIHGVLRVWYVSSIIATKLDGTVVTNDNQLDFTNVSLLAANQSNIPGLHIDPNQVDSLIHVEFPEVLTRQINSGLFDKLGALYNNLPIGTKVMVTCDGDGTNAQFKKISSTGTVMWEMVPGTLKNRGGQFIDANGNVTANPINNLSSGILPGALPNFPDYGLSPLDWQYWSPSPYGTVTVGPICDPLANPC